MEGMGEETLSFPLLKSGKRQKVHLGRSVSTHFIADCWLSINGCSHLKNKKNSLTMVWGDKTKLTSPEIRAAVTSKTLRDSGRISLLFFSSSSKTKGGSARQGKGGGWGRRNPHLTLVIVRMFNTYIYPFDEWRILILKLKVFRDYFLFMEANKMK